MEESILKSTKKILGLDENYTTFDLDVITHINTAFSTLTQLGVGPSAGVYITDAATNWSAFVCPLDQLHMVKTYVSLKVRLLFDPPNTSFVIAAAERQLDEVVWRLNLSREDVLVEEAQV